jgi:hypothetical protein
MVTLCRSRAAGGPGDEGLRQGDAIGDGGLHRF